MHRRINITLPAETLQLLDAVSGKRNRSRYIDAAVRQYASAAYRTNLRKLLKEGALRRAERDRRLAQDWFALEEEGWRQSKK